MKKRDQRQIDRCQATLASGKPCRAIPRKGRLFCLHHDQEADSVRTQQAARVAAAAVTNAATARPDQHLNEGEVKVPKTRAEVRDLLLRSLRDVLEGRLDPKRGKVVQDLCRQVLPLLPPEHEADPEERKLTDEDLLAKLELETARCRARISGGNGTHQEAP